MPSLLLSKPSVFEAADLLADTETLTSILTYHVVAGEVLAETVVTLDGQSAATVQGEEIGISIVDGGVVLNDSVNVVATDILASNGVIHVIDGVILPPSMSAGDEMMEEGDDMAEGDEMMDDMMSDNAHVRVAHFSPDAPAVDVYIDGALSDIADFPFPEITGWISLPPGDYEVAVSPAGTSYEDAVIGPAVLSLGANSWTTVAAIGSVTDGTLSPSPDR